MKNEKWKRIGAVALSAAMVLPLIPGVAYAEETPAPDSAQYVASEAVEETLVPDSTELIATESVEETTAPDSAVCAVTEAAEEPQIPDSTEQIASEATEAAQIPDSTEYVANEATEELSADQEAKQQTYKIQVEAPDNTVDIMLKKPDGSQKYVQEAAAGDRIRLTFDDNYLEGQRDFVKFVDINGNIIDMINETSYWDCYFTMPAGDVLIRAELTDNCYPVTVENGGLKVKVASGYLILHHNYCHPGKEVFLYYDQKQTPEGKIFAEWYVKSGDVQLSDPASMEYCSFTMPDHPVEIGVRYKESYAISVENGYAQYTLPNGEFIYNTNRAEPGTKMNTKANPFTWPEGMAFSKWVVTKGNVELEKPYLSHNCPFVMPAEDVEIKAEFVPGHSFKVEGGSTCKTTSDGFDWFMPYAAAGDTVWAVLQKSEVPEGKEFVRWAVRKGNVELSNPQKTSCSFIMPDEDVEIYAEYKDLPRDHWEWSGDNWKYQYADGTYVINTFKDIDGQTYYFNADGIMQKAWQWIDGTWYYFNASGHMLKGWQWIDGAWYYFNGSGHMQTGWQWIDGSCYYFYGNGAMAADTWIDGSYVNGSGVWVSDAVPTGWQWINGTWYYFNDSGVKQTGWQWIDSHWFYLNSDGQMQTGWQWLDGYWFYLNGSGHMQKGWQQIDGYWFYLDGSGHMLKGWQWIGSNWFYLDGSGHMLTGWQWIDGYWFYLDGSGHMLKGWQWLDGYWFYLDGSGHMLKGWQQIDGYWFYLDGSGHMLKGWQQIGGNWFYLDGSGHMLTGWQWIGSNWFYLNGSGHMLKGWQWLDSHWYYFYSNGAMAVDTTIDGCYVNGSGIWVS